MFMFAKCFLHMVTHSNIQNFCYLLDNCSTLNISTRNFPKLLFLCFSCIRSAAYCGVIKTQQLSSVTHRLWTKNIDTIYIYTYIYNGNNTQKCVIQMPIFLWYRAFLYILHFFNYIQTEPLNCHKYTYLNIYNSVMNSSMLEVHREIMAACL